ncbi:MAG TPA: YoaK family protein [Marmoricola sp.]|nr:YoaK family protein [Marmoricola sp.]
MTIDRTSNEDETPARSAQPEYDDHTAAARARDRLVVLLAALSGATDAIGLIALGGSFTSVMTGNMVLVGVAIGTGDASALGLTLAAIGGYVLGVYLGARVAGEPQPGDSPWPRPVTRALAVELTAFAAFAAAWWSQGGDPPSSWFGPLLAVNALALGVQSSAILRFGVSGLSTTYMTGTLTSVVTRLAARHPLTSIGRSGAVLAGLICGATAGGAVFVLVPVAVPALQLALVGVVLAGGWRRRA